MPKPIRTRTRPFPDPTTTAPSAAGAWPRLLRRLAAGVTLVAAMAGSPGCSSKEMSAAAAPCASPMRGSRYALCGELSPPSQIATSNDKRLVGSMNAAHPPIQGGQHQIQGGHFHANH